MPGGTIPLTPLTGVTVNATPLQTPVVIDIIAGVGFTVTSNVNGVPVQVAVWGVTVYVAICTELVLFESIPLIAKAPLPGPPPVNPVPAGADQLYVVPAGIKPSIPSAGVTENELPLQIISVIGDMAGFGLTVTVTVNDVPVQLPDNGVTVYVAV